MVTNNKFTIVCNYSEIVYEEMPEMRFEHPAKSTIQVMQFKQIKEMKITTVKTN